MSWLTRLVRSLFTGVTIPLALLGFLAIAILVSQVRNGGSDRAGDLRLSGTPSIGQVTLLPGEPGASAEALAFVQGTGTDSSQQRLSRIRLAETNDDAVVWQGEPSPISQPTSVVLVTANRVYVATDQQVQLLSLDTGQVIWTAQLPDRLGTVCTDCVQLAGDDLLVHSYDGTLSRFGFDSPTPRWTHRIERTSAPLLVSGDRAVVIDTPQGGFTAELQTLSNDTGDIATTIPLQCPDTDTTPGTGFIAGAVFPIPGSEDVVAAFGSRSGCVMRVDPATGAVTWSNELSDGIEGAAGDSAVLDDTHLVIGRANGLTSVDLSTGALTELEGLDDLRVRPARIVDGHVIGETITSRGTPRLGLASFDLETGRSDWALGLDIDQADADAVVDPRRVQLQPMNPTTQHVLLGGSAAELFAITFDHRSGDVHVRTVGAADGQMGQPTTRRYSANDNRPQEPDVLVAQDRRLLITADRSLRMVPLPSGEVEAWPGD